MNLYPHQEKALEQSKGLSRVAYYLDMGLGKTFVGGEKLIQLDSKVNLVVCQKSKIQDWVNHLRKYYSYPGNIESGCCPYSVFDLTVQKREFFSDEDSFISDGDSLLAGHRIYVINYDLIWRRTEILKMKNFTLLLDESSLIQNGGAKRSKFILKLNPLNVILLSGTPVSGKYENLWTQIHLLGWPISEELYNSQYVNWEKVETEEGFVFRRVNPEEPYKHVDRLKNKLREHGAFFLKTEECFELPEQNFNIIHIPVTNEYKRFRKNKIVTVNGQTLVGDHVFKERLFSRMLCGHFNSAKFQAFYDLLCSTNDRLIVFYNFTTEMVILKGFVESVKKPLSLVNGTVKDLTAYENESNSVTLIQYQAGAMGLNLQKANKVIYFTLTDKSELFEQSKKRIHRIGQNQPCFYYLLICQNSIEERMLKTLEQRKDFTDELFQECDM